YTALVAVEFAFFLFGWMSRGFDPFAGSITPWQLSGRIAGDYLPFFTIQHVLLLLLVTPALAASSVTEEKARGTLTLLLTTHLTAAEIVLGKWLGRVVQILVLALPLMPILAFLQGMCGVPPAVAAAWAVDSVLLAMVLAALSLFASV